jgi:hypothetical protein
MDASDAAHDTRLSGGNNVITISPSTAFEGQRRYVGMLGPAQGSDDLSHATVTAAPGSGLVIENVVCSMIFCAFTAHIDDVTDNRGAAIPEPTAASMATISVVGSMLNYTASLNVFPLDAADATSLASGMVATDAVYSSLTVPTGTTLRAASPDSPVRIAVLGDAEVHGTFDFAASTTGPGPGGHAGGDAPSSDGQGPLPGRGSTVAGGGGGFAEAGGNGTGPSGEMGGMGGMAASEIGAARLQGGSGGGAGGGGAGGAGGGAIALAAFGSADFTGAQFVARGGTGMGAGGGGAGGMVVIGGTPTGAFTLDASGGAGGASGGAMGGHGSAGRVQFDGVSSSAMVTGGARRDGVSFDLSDYQPIVRSAQLVLHGHAVPGAHVRIQNEVNRVVTARADVTAGADGTWSTMVMLTPGASSFIAYDASDSMNPIPSFSGTTVVVRGDAGARQVFAGALDVVYLPM